MIGLTCGKMNQAITAESDRLTKFPTASLRELAYLSLPLILSLFSASFMGFCDRLFLANYSLEAFEQSVSAGLLCILFQQPLIRITSMTQVFVGLYRGSNQVSQIGGAVWQMIWLSLLSMIVTLPFSHFVTPFFFHGKVVQDLADTYFQVMMVVNFLFPLATALSSYFIGQGKMRVIFLTTLISHGLNIGLDYLFIFGFGSIIPEMGIFGAALATGIAQTLFCIILFCFFLRKRDRKVYGTNQYKFNWDSFWMQLRVGLPRAIARVIILTAWVMTARVMILQGGDHLIVLSVGGSLILLFTFVNDGMCQGMITIASNLMGSKNYSKIWTLLRSGFAFLLITTFLLAVPYLFFPEKTLSFFFRVEPPSLQTLMTLKRSCIWLWFFFFCYGINAIGLSLVTAARDVTFYMFTIIFIWLTSCLPTYIGMNYLNWSPDVLWLIMALDSLLYGCIFLLRASKEKWKHPDQEIALNKVEV